MVQSTAKSATLRLMIAVLCLCSFCGLVAECLVNDSIVSLM